jgi:hypothetical protein
MSDKKLSKVSIVSFSEAEYNDYQKSLALKEEWPGINVNAITAKGTAKEIHSCFWHKLDPTYKYNGSFWQELLFQVHE